MRRFLYKERQTVPLWTWWGTNRNSSTMVLTILATGIGKVHLWFLGSFYLKSELWAWSTSWPISIAYHCPFTNRFWTIYSSLGGNLATNHHRTSAVNRVICQTDSERVPQFRPHPAPVVVAPATANGSCVVPMP